VCGGVVVFIVAVIVVGDGGTVVVDIRLCRVVMVF